MGDIASIESMSTAPQGKSNRCLMVFLITPEEFGADSEAIQQALEEENIEARPVWPPARSLRLGEKPMHLQPVFKDRKCVGGEVAEDLFNRGLCLPSGTAMTEEDLNPVISVILRCKR